MTQRERERERERARERVIYCEGGCPPAPGGCGCDVLDAGAESAGLVRPVPESADPYPGPSCRQILIDPATGPAGPTPADAGPFSQ